MPLLKVSVIKQNTLTIIQTLIKNIKTIVDIVKQGVYKIMSYYYTIKSILI